MINKECKEWWFVIGIIMLVLSAGFALAEQTISPGNNVTFPFNGTGNETFLCLEPEVHFFDFPVPSGESSSVNSSYCDVKATCEGEAVNGTVCNVDITLDAGEDYSKVSGACNINITVEEVEAEDCPNIASFNHYKDFSIEREGDIIYYAIDGVQYSSPLAQVNVSGRKTIVDTIISISCPSDIENITLSGEELLSVCQKTLPQQADYIGLLLNSTLRNAERSSTVSQELSDKTILCEQEMAGVREQLSACHSQRDICFQDKSDAENELVTAENSKIWWVIGFVIVFIMFLLSLVVNVLLFVNRTKGGGA